MSFELSSKSSVYKKLKGKFVYIFKIPGLYLSPTIPNSMEYFMSTEVAGNPGLTAAKGWKELSHRAEHDGRLAAWVQYGLILHFFSALWMLLNK